MDVHRVSVVPGPTGDVVDATVTAALEFEANHMHHEALATAHTAQIELLAMRC